MKKIPLLPNVITAFGLTCGLFIIFRCCMMDADEGTYDAILTLVGVLLLASFADLLDGAVARALKVESKFGGIFDSLSDAICFGVTPPVLIMQSLTVEPSKELSFLITGAAVTYSICGVLRLGRFTVMSQISGKQITLAEKKHFTGLPIPAAAMILVSSNLLMISGQFQSLVNLSDQSRILVLSVIQPVLGYFMISRWKFLSFKSLNVRMISFQSIFLTVISAVFLFYGLFNHFPITLAFLTWGYFFIAWGLSFIRYLRGKKSIDLEEFEKEEVKTGKRNNN